MRTIKFDLGFARGLMAGLDLGLSQFSDEAQVSYW